MWNQPIMYHRAHETVTGMSGSGKSHYVLETAKVWPGPVLFWNPQNDDLAKGWIQADYNNEAHELFRHPRIRVSYTPHYDDRFALKEASVIVRYALRLHEPWPDAHPLLIIWDEGHRIAREGRQGTPIHEVYQEGRKRNVFGRVVSQRPQNLSKTIVEQSALLTCFTNPYNAEYLKAHGLPGDEIVSTLANCPPGVNPDGPPNHFMQYRNGTLAGPFRL